jgi:hypothetical protein
MDAADQIRDKTDPRQKKIRNKTGPQQNQLTQMAIESHKL